MKKIYSLVTVLLVLTYSAMAQVSFSDDFESYTAGQLLAQNSTTWATWSGAGGGSDDVAVSNSLAHSGTNSVYLSSTSSTGGPTDLILPFGSQLNTGDFTFSCWYYIPSGKGGYFNYQANTIVGQVWAMDVTFNTNGTVDFTNSGTLLLSVSYPQGQWFQFMMTANLNNASWNVKFDGVSVGTFSNPVMNIASMDFFPNDNNAQMYMDDVSFSHVPFTAPALDASVMNLNIQNGLASQNRTPKVDIRNLGTTAITSFNLTTTYNGSQNTDNISGVNYAPGSVNTVTLTNTVTLASGTLQATTIISNVNGAGADGYAGDDTSKSNITSVTPAPGKIVFAEEATGTWCQWCPRGAVFMDMMTEKYDGFFAGAAVHNSDPMADSAYDANMGNWITGYPSMLVDRLPKIDPSAVEQDFLNRIVIAPKAILTNGAQWNITTRELKVSIKTKLQSNTTGQYSLACVLTEDSVHNTGSGWSQSNAYAGGGNGVMGGFELLPNPVPAAQMNYNHVARFIYPEFNGSLAAYPMSMSSGDSFIHNFTFTLPASWDENQIHIIGVFNDLNNSDGNGSIDNVSTTTIDEALSNGYWNGTDLGGIDFLNSVSSAINNDYKIYIYPNPATQESFVNVSLQKASDVVISVYSVDGKFLQKKNYGTLNGNSALPIETSLLSSGVYMIEISVNGVKETLRLVKQ